MSGPLDDDQDYRPFVVRPGDLEPAEEPTAAPTEEELRMRPPPPGMSRKDRKVWQEIEAERIASARDRARSDGDFRGGFASKPPRGLGRRGRRAFRAEDRTRRTQWWKRQWDRDQDTRAVGVVVLMVLLLGFLAFRLITRDDPTPNTAAPVAGAAALTSDAMASPTAAPTSDAMASPTAPSTASTGPDSSGPTRTSERTSQSPGSSRQGSTESGVFGNGGNTSTPGGQTTAPAAGVVTVVLTSGSPVPPEIPTGTVSAGERKSADSAGLAWFQRTCGSQWTDLFGAALTANRSLMTGPGWAYANPERDAKGRSWWAGVVDGRQTRVCLDVTVGPFDGPAPTGPTSTTLLFQANRVVTSDLPDATTTVEKVSELRTMSRGRDGLWSVGPPVMAG